MSNETKASTANIVMMLRFLQPTPPAYLKGQARLDYAQERSWYENDYIDYAGRQGKYEEKAHSDDEKFSAPASANGYLDYVSRRGSFASKGEKGSGVIGTGIFGRDGVIEGEKLERMKAELKRTKSNIWAGIISPRKEVADELLSDKKKAMTFMQENFNRFIRRTHLNPDNVEWYAGWHDDSESGIKHIQFSFWEKQPHRNSRGAQSFTQRGCIRKQALADSLEQFEEYISGHQHDVHIARDNLQKYMRQASPDAVKGEIARDLIALSKILPKVQGRAGYNHPSYAPYRRQIDALTTKLLRDVPAIRERYQSVLDKISEREGRFKKIAQGMENMSPSSDTIERLREDIKIRMANSVIGMARRFATEDRAIAWATIRAENDNIRRQIQERRERQKQRNARRKDFKRIKRAFDAWYSHDGENVLDFYEDLERLKLEENVRDGNTRVNVK